MEVKAEKIKLMDKDHEEGDESKETILKQKQLEKMQEQNLKKFGGNRGNSFNKKGREEELRKWS